MRIDAHGLTDIGYRTGENEDALGLFALSHSPASGSLHESASLKLDQLPAEGILAVVSDGVGGSNSGEIASSMAVALLAAELHGSAHLPPAQCAKAFLIAIHRVNTAICEAGDESPEHAGMGATLTALWLRPDGAWLGQLGDSRLYRLRGDEFRQLSPEHSPVGRMRLSGEITEEQARRHRYRNVIDQCLGGDVPFFRPEVLPIDVAPGDILLLCTDGLSDGLDDKALHAALTPLATGDDTPTRSSRKLVRLAKAASGRDNITALVAQLR